MVIEVKHDLGKAEAKQRINLFLESLQSKQAPQGFEIKDPRVEWTEDVLNISVQVKKGFLGLKAKAQVTVNEDNIIVDFEIPVLVSKFANEEEIRLRVKLETTKLLSSSPT